MSGSKGAAIEKILGDFGLAWTASLVNDDKLAGLKAGEQAKAAILAILAQEVNKARIEGQIKSTKILLHQATVLNDVPGTTAPAIPDYFIKQMQVHLDRLERLG